MNSFISSLQKNLKGIIFIIMSAILVPFGQMLWKLFSAASYDELKLSLCNDYRVLYS